MAIELEEWLAEIQRLQNEANNTDGCFSILEMSEATGIGENRLRRLLRAGQARGLFTIENKRRMIRRIDGAFYGIPVYRIKPAKAKKK